MTISDDGHGIHDFTTLLTIGQSGWNPEILETEHPFGIGAAAMLFVAGHIVIQSLAQQVTFHTRALLHGTPATIESLSPSFPGTLITLTLNQHIFSPHGFLEPLQSIVRGFPLPVTYNGQPLARDHAPHDDYLTTPIGQL